MHARACASGFARQCTRTSRESWIQPSADATPSKLASAPLRNLPFVPIAERRHDFFLVSSHHTGAAPAAFLREELTKLQYNVCADTSRSTSSDEEEAAVSSSVCVLTIVTAGIMDIDRYLRELRFGMLYACNQIVVVDYQQAAFDLSAEKDKMPPNLQSVPEQNLIEFAHDSQCPRC